MNHISKDYKKKNENELLAQNEKKGIVMNEQLLLSYLMYVTTNDTRMDSNAILYQTRRREYYTHKKTLRVCLSNS